MTYPPGGCIYCDMGQVRKHIPTDLGDDAGVRGVSVRWNGARKRKSSYKYGLRKGYSCEGVSRSTVRGYVCWALTKNLLEYPDAVRACAMRRYPRNLGTFLISYCFLSFFGL